MKRLLASILCLLLGTETTFAHGEGQPALSWTFDPWIALPLGVLLLLYIKGMARLWRRSCSSRQRRLWQALAYASGWLSLAGALVSPLHQLGEHLFTAHMIEHEIVITIAAPLLVLARPGGAFVWSFARRERQFVRRLVRGPAVRRSWRWLTRPLNATLLHALAIWIWHVPPFFDAAVVDLGLHRLQHLSFFATAVLFWWSLLWRAEAAVATGELFITMIHTGILGALMSFAPRVLYAVQTSDAPRWGLTPLEDQQLAGLVMWVLVGTIYAGVAIAFFASWIQGSSRGWRTSDARAP
jgi:putative membrane protein